MFCRNCGTQVPENAAFCGNCGTPSRQKRKTLKKSIVIAVCVFVLMVLIVGVVLVLGLPENYDESPVEIGVTETSPPALTPRLAPAPAPAPESEPETELEEMESSQMIGFDMTQIDAIISNHASLSQVAVGVVVMEDFEWTSLTHQIIFEPSEFFTTVNGTEQFVASGFYIPLYFMSWGSDHYFYETAARMMRNMDNTSANALINGIGGFSALNNALRAEGFSGTSFSRNFGDTAASQRGEENYTTANDAVRMLFSLYAFAYHYVTVDGHTWMNFDLTRDGIALPTGVTVHAHRGAGVGNAYNVFAVMVTPAVNYGIVILTENVNNPSALITELFANTQQQMVLIHG